MDKEKSYLDPDENEEEEVEVDLEDDAEKPEEEEPDESDSESESEAEEGEEDSKEKFGQRAQKRIRTLVRRAHELESEKTNLAGKVKELEAKLQEESGRYDQTQEFAVSQFKAAIEAKADALESQWYDAYEQGDQKRLLEVQKGLARVEAERMRIEDYDRQVKKEVDTAPPSKSEAQDPQAKGAPQLHPKTVRWLRQNQNWFGKDNDMSRDAFFIDKELVEEGIDPTTDEYYTELDKRIRELYPDSSHFKTKVNQTVTGGSRTPAKRKSKVHLSAQEKAFCDRNRIDYERYAREKLKLNS